MSFTICNLTNYYGDQFKENEMDGACSMHGEDEKCLTF